MADENTSENENVNDDGQQSESAGGSGQSEQANAKFTDEQQAEIESKIAARLARERQKYADYDQLKAAAAKWAEAQEAEKSEVQKLNEKIEKLEREKREAADRLRESTIQQAFLTAGADANLANPLDAYRLADKTAIAIDDDGTVTGVKEQVQALIEAKRLPLKSRPSIPDLEGGAGSTPEPGASKNQKLSDAERAELAAIYHIDPKYLD